MLKQGLYRTNSIVYKDLNDLIQIIQYQTDCTEYALNETALWIWFLVEPNTTKEELIEKVIAAYPDQSIEQVEEEIDVLITQGLIEQREHNQVCSLIDNLNVYIDCFDDIIKNKSYLLRFLCHVANMTTVVSEIDQADVVFCSDPNTIEDDDDRLFVLLSESPTEAQAMVFDYIISCKEAWSPHHLKWTRFPTAAFDQDEYEKIVEETDTGYSIERIATRFRHFLTGQEANTESKSRISEVDEPLLTIGMATHNDYDGLYFSLTSLQIHHPLIFAQSEIIILDNNPDGKEAPHLEALAACNANVRYVPYRDKNSTAVRDILFSLAKGEWVLCMDSHVMLPGGVLQQLVDYMMENPDSKDLLQGPILDDSGQVYASHFKAEWRAGMYGIWGLDDRATSADSDPFEIEMQGLGLFACRKQAWPGFNNLFIGFGGEEGYIHQKIRNQGGKCLCLPFLRWSHRFARPHGASYPNKWEDRIKNYLIGFEEAGLDTQQIQDHFDSFLPARAFNTAKHEVEQIKASPFQQFDHAVCINLDSKKLKWEQMQKRFDQIHIKDRVKRFSAISTPEFHHTGCALSHRKIIEQAKLYGYESVLVFEDDSLMLSGADVFLSHALKELQDRQWKILYLGGANHRFEFELVEGCSNLKEVPKFRLTCTHALIYHHSVYDELLDELPSNEYEMEQWLVHNYAIDQYLCKIDSRYLVEPKLFTQPNLRNNENIAYRQFYK